MKEVPELNPFLLPIASASRSSSSEYPPHLAPGGVGRGVHVYNYNYSVAQEREIEGMFC